ncbi:radical SAM protein [uncultured Brachyspira sp.]|uniref:radical SAM protein n=1 Tax=uncultured Brachyspira sp. TaxID=221953 RepID=UPI00261FF431|nr:radical SAM protein [uncultured Brachyspira sp.]
MDQKLINDIVWWIPFKKLRNAVREYLLKIINIDSKLEEINNRMNIIENSSYSNYIDSKLEEINNRINVIDNNLHNNYIDLYRKIRRVTPQPCINFVEIHLAEHCNLNCYSCNHFSQLAAEEYYDIDIFENDIRRLYELTNGLINRFQLMGGEPLLNKNCKDYFYIVRKYFKNSLIWLITNGILLPKQDENFWVSCKENRV